MPLKSLKTIALLSLISIQVLAADQRVSAPQKSLFSADQIVACLTEKGDAVLDIGKKITSGSLEITDLGDTSMVYKLNVTADIDGVQCAFDMTGFAPQVTGIENPPEITIHRGFSNNQGTQVQSACAMALNITNNNITFIRNANDVTVVVKGVEASPAYNECGALIFKKN
jgi:hypothetical protein